MTQNATIAINLTSPDATRLPAGSLRLVQEPWGDNIGRVSKSEIVGAVFSRLFGSNFFPMPSVDCGFSADGIMKCLIYAYPEPANLNYKLHASYGELSKGVTDKIDEAEGIIFDSSSTANLNHSADLIEDYSWSGDVFDLHGDKITPPSVSFSGVDVKLGQPVNGVLIVNYKLIRHTYTLTVSPREGAEQGKYSSVVYGLFLNGISWTPVDPPPNADDYDMNAVCGSGYNLSISPSSQEEDGEDEDGTPTAAKSDRKIDQNYCTREIISDSAA